MPRPALPFAPNPDYGTGAARRRVTLRGGDGVVDGHLYDTFHELRCTIRHDGAVVTGVDGATIRIPTTACPAAVGALRELVGLPLATPPAELAGDGRQRRNCTHLFDLAVLAIRHVPRGPATRVYEAVIPDETDAPVWAEVWCDGVLAHRWRVSDDRIVEPAALAGLPLREGVGRWAAERFAGDDLDAALMLARTCFLTGGRRYLTDVRGGEPVDMARTMSGVCYAYSPDRAGATRFIGDNVRDLSAGLPPG